MFRSTSSLPLFLALALAACTAAPTPTATRPPAATQPPPTSTPAPTHTPSPTPEPPAAALSELVNLVDARPGDSGDWASAIDGQKLLPGGGVRTGEDSSTRIDLVDGSIVRLTSASTFRLETLAADANSPLTRLTLLGGRIFVALGELFTGATLEIETPVGVASVRGSILGVVYDADSGEVVVGCLEGHCAVSNDAGTQELTDKQQSSVAAPDRQPEPPQPMSAEFLKDFGNIPEAQTALTTGDVVIPFLPCLADGTCDTYCAPPEGGTEPPAGCIAVQDALIAQGVDFEAFKGCVLSGGGPQACANTNRRQP